MTLEEKINLVLSKGYFIDKEGNVFGPSGQKLKGQRKTTDGGKSFYLNFRFKIPKTGNNSQLNYHQFQAYMKFGKALFLTGIQTRHLDGNSLNNVWDNISIGNAQENTMDKTPETRIRVARIAAAKQRKLTQEEWANLIADRNRGYTYKQLGNKYCLAKSTISYIVNGKTYQNGPPAR